MAVSLHLRYPSVGCLSASSQAPHSVSSSTCFRKETRPFSAIHFKQLYELKVKDVLGAESRSFSIRTSTFRHFAKMYSPVRASGVAENGELKESLESVAIVGGGLGGLATAIALRSRGINAQVYEKNPSIMGGEGTLISLFPNGLRALSLADPTLVSKLIAAGVPNPISHYYTPGGQFVSKMDITQEMEKMYGFPMLAIRWREVLNIMYQYLPLESIHTGYELVGIEQDEDKVIAKFIKDGQEKSVETPLLIGADGIRSKVREAVVGPDSPIRDNGRAVWRAIIPFDRYSHPMLEKGVLSTFLGEGRTALVGDSGMGYLFAAYTVLDSFRGDRAKERSKNGEEAKKLLKELFEGWELPLNVLEVIEPEEIIERRVLDMPVLERWAYGRVALLGDAAHALSPSSGQGANSAFEDGWEIAAQLSSKNNLRDALEAYEKIRVPRVQNILSESEAFTKRAYSKKPPLGYENETANSYDFFFAYEGTKCA